MLDGHANFTETNIMHEGKACHAFEVKCGRCTFLAKVRSNTIGGSRGGSSSTNRELDHQRFLMVKKKLERDGWVIGRAAHHDLCPRCVLDQNTENRKQRENGLDKTHLIGSTSLQQTPPKQMSVGISNQDLREPTVQENKKIRDKLDEVYTGEDSGYAPGWTDTKVSDVLNCPRAWVVSIREMLYGKATTNPEIERTIREASRINEATSECLRAFDVRRAELFDLLKASEVVLRDLEAKYK